MSAAIEFDSILREPGGEHPGPCVVVVMPDEIERRIVCEELTERGFDAVGLASLGHLLVEPPRRPDHEQVAVVLVDRAAAVGRRDRLVEIAHSRYAGVPFVLLSGKLWPSQPGPWQTVLRRPISLAELASQLSVLAARGPAVASMTT